MIITHFYSTIRTEKNASCTSLSEEVCFPIHRCQVAEPLVPVGRTMADDASSHVPGGRSMANAASQRRGAPLGHLLASVRASVTRPVSSAASAPLSNHFFGPPRSNCPHGEEPSLPIFSWPSFLGALPGLSIPVMFVFTSLFCDLLQPR